MGRSSDEISAIDPVDRTQGGRSTRGSPSPASSSRNFREAGAAAAPPEAERLAEISSEALSEELRARTALHREAGSFSLLLTEEEAEELWYGRVPKRVREMAKAGLDWFWDDLLAANAAKPLKLSKVKATKTA